MDDIPKPLPAQPERLMDHMNPIKRFIALYESICGLVVDGKLYSLVSICNSINT